METAAVIHAGPGKLDLTGIRAGDRNEFAVTLHHGDVGIDLTGYDVQAQARKQASDQDPAVTAVCTITDPPQGQLTMTWPGEDVAALMPGTLIAWCGVWDMQITPSGGVPQTVIAGRFKAEMDVTR